MSFFMGIDLGTSSLKTIIINENGDLIGSVSEVYQFDSPYPGFAEQDPEVWWNACILTIQHCIAKFNISPKEIKALSFSGQMHGLVSLDSEYKPVRPAILHCDTRSISQVEWLRKNLSSSFIAEELFNPFYTGFLLPSLLWVRENESENYSKIKHVCLPKDYIKMKLSGVLTSDFADASGTLAFNIKSNHWNDEVLSVTNLSKELFPVCVPSTTEIGYITDKAAQLTGLMKETKVVAGAGDLVMQNTGSGMIEKGAATINIGSSGQVCFPTKRLVVNPALNTNIFCGHAPNQWILFGATMNAGLSLKWWRSVSNNQSYNAMEKEISKIAPGSGGVIFHPYLNGERCPHVNPAISGSFFGLSSELTRAHMTRSVMEGVTYSLYQCAEVCNTLGLDADYFIAAGGGARSQTWLQIQADVFNRPVRTNLCQEQAGLGAAITAAVGINHFSSVEDGCRQVVKYHKKIYIPNAENSAIYQEYFHFFKQIYHESAKINQQLTTFARKK